MKVHVGSSHAFRNAFWGSFDPDSLMVYKAVLSLQSG